MYVIHLSQVCKDSILTVGGKGANLGEMIKNKFPVPQGFCVTSLAYDTYMKENSLTKEVETTLSAIKETPENAFALSSSLMNQIQSGTVSKEMYEEIKQAYQKSGNRVRVAVRSSATAEDLPDASFAGQQETYLNVFGIEDVIDSIKRCFASLWTDRAISYRQKTGFCNQKISLAIVVQEMIEGDISGVLFTVNPMNGHSDEIMINASYGLGESIVSGMVTPDTYIWNKTKNIIMDKYLGSKEISVIYAPNSGTVQKQNPSESRKKYCLSVRQIKALSSLSQKIETHYGTPQDIEWTIKDGNIHILQARPITTLKVGVDENASMNQPQNKRERMMMNNLLEHCPTPLYPLDFEPLSALSRIKSETLKDLGIKLTQADAFSFKENGEFEIQKSTIKLTPLILLLPLHIKQYQDFKENDSKTKEVFQTAKVVFDNLELSAKETMPLSALLEQLQELMTLADKIIYTRFRYNIFPSFVLGKSIHLRLTKFSPPISQYDLFSGLHYKTWDMNLALTKLASLINQNESLHASIKNISAVDNLDNQLNHIAANFPAFDSLYQEIINEYGWKSTSTYYAFSGSSWKENKSHFLTLLQIALAQTTSGKDYSKYSTICKQIEDSLSPKKASKLLQRIKQLRVYHQNREESLYLLETCYGLSRKLVKIIAKKIPTLFTSPEDILYLTLGELYLLNNNLSEDNIKSKIDLRKQSMLKNQILWNKLETHSVHGNMKRLKGISGNKGTIKGTVCIVHNLSEFNKLKQGEILVCKYTDPIWTPLFTLAKAVVSDTGGPLSHSAIVAREYNIPAVLGCGNATKLLSDGQEILVNGDEGIVHILS